MVEHSHGFLEARRSFRDRREHRARSQFRHAAHLAVLPLDPRVVLRRVRHGCAAGSLGALLRPRGDVDVDVLAARRYARARAALHPAAHTAARASPRSQRRPYAHPRMPRMSRRSRRRRLARPSQQMPRTSWEPAELRHVHRRHDARAHRHDADAQCVKSTLLRARSRSRAFHTDSAWRTKRVGTLAVRAPPALRLRRRSCLAASSAGAPSRSAWRSMRCGVRRPAEARRLVMGRAAAPRSLGARRHADAPGDDFPLSPSDRSRSQQGFRLARAARGWFVGVVLRAALVGARDALHHHFAHPRRRRARRQPPRHDVA
jgi:hypothetical protein